MTDVPSHTWIVPTVLKHAGVDFLHLGCNSASGSPDVPLLFWWEGPDGSRVLTMYEASGYGSGLRPPADWPHKTWLALIHTGDNHGPPPPGQVQKLLDQAALAAEPGVVLVQQAAADEDDGAGQQRQAAVEARRQLRQEETGRHGERAVAAEQNEVANGEHRQSTVA